MGKYVRHDDYDGGGGGCQLMLLFDGFNVYSTSLVYLCKYRINVSYED